jgi:hypothetical protein
LHVRNEKERQRLTSDDSSEVEDTVTSSRRWHSSRSAFSPRALWYRMSGLFTSSYKNDKRGLSVRTAELTLSIMEAKTLFYTLIQRRDTR